MVYSTRRFVLCLTLCYFVLVFFSPFSIAITSLGEERVVLVRFVRLFNLSLFGFVCFLFLLRFVIMALPIFFSYLFFLEREASFFFFFFFFLLCNMTVIYKMSYNFINDSIIVCNQINNHFCVSFKFINTFIV